MSTASAVPVDYATIQTGDGPKKFKVVSSKDWLKARSDFLVREKELTRLRDILNEERRELPWERVEKNYIFDSTNARQESLSDLFDDKTQLIVYHFMFAPDWDEACSACSLVAEGFDGVGIHLRHRDTTFLAISRAPQQKIDAYKKRMGWTFKWISSFSNDFNHDYFASFTPAEVQSGGFFNYRQAKPYQSDASGASVFVKDAQGQIYHTYSTFNRGIEMLMVTYQLLDMTPKGRDEANQKPYALAWARRHDQYEDEHPAAKRGNCCDDENGDRLSIDLSQI